MNLKNNDMCSININQEFAVQITKPRFKKYTISTVGFLMTLIFLLQSSCRKFVEVDTPPDKVTQANVYSNDRTANSVLIGIYSVMYYSSADMAKYTGLLSDELTLWSGAETDLIAYYTNGLVANQTTNTGKEIWNTYYNLIFTCNGAIEGLSINTNLTSAVKKQLLGEAHFMRAWFYFYLVNLYGDLPLATSTNPIINNKLNRSSKQVVYQLIIEDLLKSQDLLSHDYVNGQLIPGSSERVRPTIWAADALLARVYLYNGEDAKAEMEANKVIAHSAYFSLAPYTNVFLKNNKEAIWQTQPTDIGWNTRDARMFNLSAEPAGLSFDKPVFLSNSLLTTFEPDDKRKVQWIDSFNDGIERYYFPFKYKIGEYNSGAISPGTLTEYCMMLRLGEQYLIRAEARARQNNLSGAIADLDIIRDRAGLSLIGNSNPSITQTNLLAAILHERQAELFSEWGHRWFDLKRFGKTDEVMRIITPIKGGTWQSTDQLLPIPYSDLLYGPNLTQNAGY